MKFMTILAASLLAFHAAGFAQNDQTTKTYMEKLELTQEWDKVFPKSDKVNHSKVTFHNRYGITLAADLYIPKNATGKLPAIAVSGPFGAVKEQASGLYAQTLAERGFLTIAFLSTLLIQGKVADNPAMSLHLTSTRKISVRLWIIWQPAMMWMPNASAYSASADGEDSPSMRRLWIHASKLP